MPATAPTATPHRPTQQANQTPGGKTTERTKRTFVCRLLHSDRTVNSEIDSRISAALEAAGKIAEVGVDFRLLKKRLGNAVDDAVLEAERVAKHGRRAKEDVMEDTTHWMKKNPWRSVGYVAGAAFGMGLCLAWFSSRMR